MDDAVLRARLKHLNDLALDLEIKTRRLLDELGEPVVDSSDE